MKQRWAERLAGCFIERNETNTNGDGQVNNKDESDFDEILRELDHIREIASNYSAEQIEALQRELAIA
jgi:uncharacterized membrane protein